MADVLATVQANAKVLSEALPYMQRYDKQTVVVKYGGHAMGDPELAANFARDIVLHQAGRREPDRGAWRRPADRLAAGAAQYQIEFKGGLRVTDRATVEVVEMVLAGSVNKEIVTAINNQGGKAVGISGKDANLMRAKRLERRDARSLFQHRGDRRSRLCRRSGSGRSDILDSISISDLIPVVAPIGVGPDGETSTSMPIRAAGARHAPWTRRGCCC